jgi:hypothetical protein
LVRSESIDLQNIEQTPCRLVAAAAARDTTPDCKLLALLERLAPDRRAAPRPELPTQVDAEVLFFDMPGNSRRPGASSTRGR